MRDTVRKHAKGWYARRFFDGSHGVPKMTMYLTWRGYWQDGKLTADCFFPTRELCEGLLALRNDYEDVHSELRELRFKHMLATLQLNDSDPQEVQDAVIDAALNELRQAEG